MEEAKRKQSKLKSRSIELTHERQREIKCQRITYARRTWWCLQLHGGANRYPSYEDVRGKSQPHIVKLIVVSPKIVF